MCKSVVTNVVKSVRECVSEILIFEYVDEAERKQQHVIDVGAILD